MSEWISASNIRKICHFAAINPSTPPSNSWHHPVSKNWKEEKKKKKKKKKREEERKRRKRKLQV